jgi:hypothetical protein
MVNKIQILRSNTYGNRPAVGAQPYGAPYVNFAGKQFGVVDSAGTPQDLVGVPYFSATANYNAGQPVNYQGQLYAALVNVIAGAWNASQWTPVATQASATPLDALAYNGMQINGSCDVSQINGTTPVTLTSNALVYVVDNWAVGFGNATATFRSWQTASGLSGFTNCLALQTLTPISAVAAGDFAVMYNYIEGIRMARLGFGTANAQPITIGFWIQAPMPGTMALSIRNGPTATRFYIANVTINTALVWQWVTVTIPGDTVGTWVGATTSLGIIVGFCFAAGSNYQTAAAGVWSTVGGSTAPIATTSTSNFFSAANTIVYITGLIVLPGTEALSSARSALIMRPYGQELAICQRYWEVLTYNMLLNSFQPGAYISQSMSWAVPKRASPTLGNFTTPAMASANAPAYATLGLSGVCVYSTSTAVATQCQVSGSVYGDARY